MTSGSTDPRTKTQLLEQNEDLRRRLDEAEQTLEAIRTGDVDALVVSNAHGEQVYTLTGAEHVYRVVVETMNEAALTVDPDGTILFCNQRFCDLMKTPMHEALGRKVIEFVARPQRHPLEGLMAAAQAGPVQRRITLQAADGTAVPVQLSASLLHADGSASICLVASDLTELEASANSIRVLREHQQALEESESRFRTIFEASQDAIVLVDDDQVYVQANPAVEAVFGLPPDQLLGRRVPEFVDIATDFEAMWRMFRREGTFHGEMRIIDANSQVRIVDCYAVANILPGRHLAVIRDITERKLAQEALEEANAQLEVRTSELSIQAEELNAQTEELRVTNEELLKTERALRESRAEFERQARFFDATVSAIPDYVYAFDRDKRFVYVNQAMVRLYGRKQSEVIGRNFADLNYPPELASRLNGHIEHIFATGESIEDEVFYASPTGLAAYFHFIWGPVRDANGNIELVVGTSRDTTLRKRAEEALRESEKRYHRLFEDDLTGDFISTPDGQILLCNPAFARIFGFSSATEAVGTSMLDLYTDPADRESTVERLKRQGKIERFETWRKRRDGEPIYIVENLVGHINDRGELYEIKGYIFDDTDRKRAEEALRESEQRLKLAQRAARIGVFDWDIARDRSIWTEEFYTIFGLSPEDCDHPTEAWQRIVPPEERARVEQEFWAAVAERRPDFATEYRILRPGGAIGWVVNMTAIAYNEAGEPIRMTGVALDITERREAENILRIKDTAIASSLNAIAMADLEGRLTYINPAFLTLWGYEDEREVLGRSVLEFWEEPQRAREIVQAIRNREGWIGEMTAVRKDGGTLILYLFANTVFDEAGAPLCMIGSFVDITQRKRAEQELRETEKRLAADLDAMTRLHNVGTLFAQEGNLERVLGEIVETATAISGADFGNIQLLDRGSSTLRIVAQRGFPTWWLDFWNSVPPGQGSCGTALARGERVIVEDVERSPIFAGTPGLEIQLKAGVRAIQSTPLVSRSGRPLGMFSTHYRTPRRPDDRVLRLLDLLARQASDIIERAQYEESLRELTRTLEARVAERTAELEFRARQLQKLALELSQAEDRERKRLAEILHDDLQQQLAAAKFHVGIMASRVRGDLSVQKYAAQIDKMLRDAVETSRNLSHELSPAVMYHGDLGEILEWLANQIHAKHGLIVHVDAYGEINTESDALKAFLFKAVQEMLFNAVKHARVGEAKVRIRRIGRYITLSVSDRGRGFEPQELKQTTGFGLMSIRERIELLGGRMRIHSIRGWGSRFILTIPDGELAGDSEMGLTARPVTQQEIDRIAADGAQPQRTFRVLIADDHEIVRQGLASLLNEARDIEVVGEAANGREAVDMTYHLRPDVVIMDVAMPLMSGEEATKQIRKHLPQTRIVALSMYDEVGMMDRMHRAGAEDYILKTAPADEVLTAVRGRP